MSIQERSEKGENAAAKWGNTKNAKSAKSAKSRSLHDAVAKDMVDAAPKVTSRSGARLLESAYQACLAHKFQSLHAFFLACLALLAFRSS